MKWTSIILLIAVSFVILAVYSGGRAASSTYEESREMIVLRKVLHELMLSSGDSVSRVMPVRQISADEFHLLPEKPLAISPDSFVNIVSKSIHEGKLLRNFTASVVKYQGGEVVYGFAVSPVAGESVMSCQGRNLPKDRYYLRFIFSPQQKGIPWSSYWYGGCAAIALALSFFLFRKRKFKRSVDNIAPPAAAIEDLGKERPLPVGKYLFNPLQQYLELNGERTMLTIKESKVLAILAGTPNAMVERELIQKEVWENEGVIVTRSLDMFISKLRKKLIGDPAITIVNVHGKGYKLSIAVA